MKNSTTGNSSIIGIFTPISLRIQQLRAFRIECTDTYKLPASKIDIEAIKHKSLKKPSLAVIEVVANLIDQLAEVFQQTNKLRLEFIQNNSDGIQGFHSEDDDILNAVESVLDETLGLMVELDSLVKLHDSISMLIKGGEKKNKENITEWSPKPKDNYSTTLNLPQFALLIKFMEEARIILPHSNSTLAKIAHILTSYNTQNIRTTDGFGSLHSHKTDGNLLSVTQALQQVIELIENTPKVKPKKKRSSD